LEDQEIEKERLVNTESKNQILIKLYMSEQQIIEGSEKIYNFIKENKKGIIGRHGSTELQMILYGNALHALEHNSGIFPITNSSVKEWIQTYKEATMESDIFAAGWYKPLAEEEIKYLYKLNKNLEKIPLRSLEPYYTNNPWSRILEGKRVTVVSSFADTMKKQIDKPIWDDPRILPKAMWNFVRTYYCPAIAKGKCEWSVNSWKEAVDHLECEVLKTDPEIVLIGCGALAMPLGLRLKKNNIIAIILGGAIQILFGIKGLRWESHPVISRFFNDSWVFPSDDEIPGGAEIIEGGCYF